MALLLISFLAANSTIRLPAFLSSRMVLQQKSLVLLWGTASPGSAVSITTSWDNRMYSAPTDKEGQFSLPLRTPAGGAGYTLTFRDPDGAVVLREVGIGEVWFCAGQSNMEMPLKGFSNQPVLHADSIVAAAGNPQLRLFTTGKAVSFDVLDRCSGSWEMASPEVAATTSAVAFQFGQQLQKSLGVPVGIIVSAWGGTPIRSWMSRESLASLEAVRFERPDTVTSRTPAALFNGMIAPFTRFTIRGILWYQGENDHRTPDDYQRLLPAMVRDWRARFLNPHLPFYYVQIAPWHYTRGGVPHAAIFREMQYRLSEQIPYSGVVVTTDVGSPKTIHPPDKTRVAERLLRLALARTYHKKVCFLGPQYRSVNIQVNKAVLRFRHAKGLHLKEGGPNLFEIAGADRVFYPATARVVSGRLEVESPQVPHPVAVRYAYSNYVSGALYNKEGLPASTFRTDHWDLTPDEDIKWGTKSAGKASAPDHTKRRP